MKTKNVKVRFEDVKNGRTMHTAHPVYGIDTYQVTGKPFLTSNGSWFFPAKKVWDDQAFSFVGEFSIIDCGISGSNNTYGIKAGYNGRRTFFKKKHAIEWMNKWKNDPSFIKKHEDHVSMCDLWADFDDEMWDRDYELED